MEIVQIKTLKHGDLVDLQGDIFADPNKDHPALEYEYAQVLEIDKETTECFLVYFDSIAVGFPPDHFVRTFNERD